MDKKMSGSYGQYFGSSKNDKNPKQWLFNQPSPESATKNKYQTIIQSSSKNNNYRPMSYSFINPKQQMETNSIQLKLKNELDKEKQLKQKMLHANEKLESQIQLMKSKIENLNKQAIQLKRKYEQKSKQIKLKDQQICQLKQQLYEDKTRWNDQIETSKLEINQLTASKDQIVREISILTDRLSQQSSKNKLQIQEFQKIKQEKECLQIQNQKLKQQKQMIKCILDYQKKKLSEESDKFETQLVQRKQKLERQTANCKKLQIDIKQKKNIISELTSRLQDNQFQIMSLEQKVSSLLVKYEIRNEQINEQKLAFQKQINLNEIRMSEYIQKNEKLSQQNKIIKIKNQDLQKQKIKNFNLQRQLNQKDKSLENLRQQLQRYSKRAQQLKTQKDKQSANFRQQILKYQQGIQQSKRQNKKQQQIFRQHLRQLNQKNQKQWANFRQQIQKHQKQIQQLKQQNLVVQRSLKQANTKIQKDKIESERNKELKDKLVADLKNQTKQKTNLSEKNKQLLSQAAQFQKMISSIQSEKINLTEKLTLLKRQHAQTKKDFTNCTNIFQIIKTSLKQHKYDSSLSKNSDIPNKIDALKKNILQLQKQIIDQNKNREKQHKEKDSIIKEKETTIQNLTKSHLQSENILKEELFKCREILQQLNQWKQKQFKPVQFEQQISDQLKEDQNEYMWSQNSWIYNHQMVNTVKYIIQQITLINNREFETGKLLYRYSPENSLTWEHLADKSNILILIKTITNKMISAYSLVPLAPSNTANPQNGEQKALIFESDLEGNNKIGYSLISGKKANGCFGKTIAFGNSDIRFAFGDNKLQGHFGYGNTSFERFESNESNERRTISQLLGTRNKQTKVEMVAYEIYQIIFKQNSIEDMKNTGINTFNESAGSSFLQTKNTQSLTISSNINYEKKIAVMRKSVFDKHQQMIQLQEKLRSTISGCQNCKLKLAKGDTQIKNNANVIRDRKVNEN